MDCFKFGWLAGEKRHDVMEWAGVSFHYAFGAMLNWFVKGVGVWECS